jgi:hypothetical protein
MLHLAPSTRPPLYKYGRWAHTEDLIRWGRIRVGTLRDYRNIERHAAGIGDAGEGHKELNEIIGEATGETLSDFSVSVMEPWFPGIAGASGVYIANTEVRLRVASPNCWLYCTSQVLSYRVMDSFEANYDACVTITHVAEFYDAIGTELAGRGLTTRGFICPVTYRERLRDYRADDRLPPWAIKAPTPRYVAQQEVRFVYLAAQEITTPHIDLTLPVLKAFCEPATNIPG